MRTDIRELVKELLENENLIVSYNELNDGGFDLSVRINNEALNKAEMKINSITDSVFNPKFSCPHCFSENVQSMYGQINLDGSGHLTHYICNDCHEEFDVHHD